MKLKRAGWEPSHEAMFAQYKSNSVVFRVEYFIFPFRPLWEKAHPQLLNNNNHQFLLNMKK